MPTDTERIDALIKLAADGDCPALINDDNGHWAVVSDGFQTLPVSQDADDVVTTFIIPAGGWFDDPRSAIDEYVRVASGGDEAEGDDE